MDSTVDRAKKRVQSWTEVHSQVVLYDDANATLLDLASGKRIRVYWRDVVSFEEKVHRETAETYLVLLFENGMQIALVDPGGIAFAPSYENSGTVEDLPSVVCLRDFHMLKQRVDHYLGNHPEEPPPGECVTLIMICIAILDGARAVGFDVGDLEADLEKSLNQLEGRTA